MNDTLSKQHTGLIKRFHAMMGKAGVDQENKLVILAQYGVDSSKDLTISQLSEICNALDRQLKPQAGEMDMWRKKVIGVIGSWLKKLNKENDMPAIRGIACRATGNSNFNAIPKERLISLYYAFRNKSKDIDFVEKITAEEIELQTICN
jgi:hypothetical protein